MWARALTVCGAVAAAATVAGHAVAATPSPARALNGGDVQANPGGIVVTSQTVEEDKNEIGR